MKGLFIINPSSGRQNFIDKIKEIAGMLVIDQICNTIDVFYTEKQDDALNKAAALEKGQYDFVVAVGGDGTLNEVINGVVLSQSNTPVAVISAGTVNDFATYLNLPQTPKEFCDMIADFYFKKGDVGKVNEKYFINVVAAGLLSDTGFKVSKDKKAVMGKLAYYLEGAAELPKQFGKSWKMKFITDDKTVEEFTEVAEKYILYIKDRAAEGVRLVPDVEGFCSFAGISRETLNNWETARPGAYSDTIKRLKTSIAAFKKQLAFAGKIPPIVFATDMNNNHGYTQAAQKIDLNVGKQAAELPTAAEIAQRLPVEMSGKDPADTDGDINI